MSDPVLLNLSNKLRKRDKMRVQSTQSAYTVNSKGSDLTMLLFRLF